MTFAKIYESEKYGQILVKLDAGSEGEPEIRFYTKPPTLGVCSIAIAYEDSDEGFDTADVGFGKVTFEMAEAVAAQMFVFVE